MLSFRDLLLQAWKHSTAAAKTYDEYILKLKLMLKGA